MPIVSGSGGTTRGSSAAAASASAAAGAPAYVAAAQSAIQSAVRDWISNATVRGEVTGGIVHFKGGCLTSSKPIEAPVRDAMITAGAPALLAVAVAGFVQTTWQNWASQLRAVVVAFPELEAYAFPNVTKHPSSVLSFPLSTLQSPGNALFAYSTFAGQMREVAAPFFPGAPPPQVASSASQQHQALSVSTNTGGASSTAPRNGGTPKPQIFAGVLQSGTSPLDLFAGLGSWFSASFDDWFLGAGIGRLYATAVGISLLPYGAPPFKMYGTCEGSLKGTRSFGERV
jgi:hypothetical protein